jgi:multimeric flavodoxin WrbA
VAFAPLVTFVSKATGKPIAPAADFFIMKVTGIAGSPRGKNSSTLRLIEAALAGAGQAGAEVEIIDITKLQINYCKGCGTCYSKGRCGQDDDFCYVLDKITDSDGIVLGSPAYFDSVTAQMKTLMDRMSDAIHCQQLSGKYGFAVCTTGSSGEGPVTNYMNDFLIMCGAFVTGGVGAAVGIDPCSMDRASKTAYAMGKDLVIAVREKRAYPEQEDRQRKIRKWLRERILANKEPWAHDYFYWTQQGWI